MKVSKMGEKDEVILRLLAGKGELTTSEVETAIRGAGNDCPDGAVKSLMRLKTQGLIEGRIDRERRGWVWRAKGG
jgi:hypothetical protein